MPVIAIVNQKGGTGKTTLSIDPAWTFAETAQVVLLDADSADACAVHGSWSTR